MLVQTSKLDGSLKAHISVLEQFIWMGSSRNFTNSQYVK